MYIKESPTIKELAGILGSSHQNVKQILLKLQKNGFVDILPDAEDKRKQRVVLTEKCMRFCQENDDASNRAMETIFRGIQEEQLRITIQTIMQMEDNLKTI